MTYQGSDKQTREIASELGVSTILEGSVRKAGDLIRITVQMIDGKSDKHLWSQSYDGKLDSIFAFQSNIAQAVANELKAQIAPDVKQRIDNVPTRNLQAYSLYLEAIRGDYTSDETKQMLEQAIQLDPDFADAYTFLGINKLFRIIVTRLDLAEDLDAYLAEVKSLFNKALELGPDNAMAYLRLGNLALWFEWDFEKAEHYFKKSHDLNPSELEAANSEFLLSVGRFEEALENSFKRIRANPMDPYSWMVHGLCCFFNDKKNLAIDAIRIGESKTDELNIITDGNMYRLFIFLEMYDQLIRKYEQLTVNQPSLSPRINCMAAIAFLHTGSTERTEEILAILKTQSEESPIGSPAFHVAMIYAQQGKINQAYKWLDKAYQDREVEMYWLKVEPPFQPLYDDPRWEEMLNKVGFPKT